MKRPGLKTWLDRYAHWLMTHPRRVLLGTGLVMLALGSQLPELRLDTDLEHFIGENAPARQAYNQAKEVYGRNDVIVVGARADNVLSGDTLAELAELHDGIAQEVPWVRRVNSLINAPYQQGTSDGLLVDDLIPRPLGQLSPEQIEERITRMPALEGRVVNRTRTFTTLVIEPYTYDFDPDAVAREDDAFGDAFGQDFMSSGEPTGNTEAGTEQFLPIRKTNELIQALQAELAGSDLDTVVAGMPVVNQQLEQTMKTEMLTFIRLTLALIVGVLVLFFRRVAAVVAPMAAVGLAVLATFSLLAISGQTVQMPLILVPSFLLAITVGDAVHLLTHFFRAYNSGQPVTEAMRQAIRVTALPMLLTSLTTAGGLITLASGDLVPIANLGMFSAIGVMLAFVLTLVMIPALIAVWPLARPRTARQGASIKSFLQGLAELNWRHGRLFAGSWLLAVALALTGVLQLRFSFDPLDWMPENLPIRIATDTIDEQLSGTINMDIIVDTGQPGGIKNPDLLQALDAELTELQAGAPGGMRIGQAHSLLDIVKSTHQALHQGRPDSYDLPRDAGLLAEELLLFENSGADELTRLVDPAFRETKVTLIMPWRDMLAYQDFIPVIESRLGSALAPWADVWVTGLLPLLSHALDAMVHTTAWSYGLAALVITAMLMLLLRSVGLGAVAMLPNLAPILVVMGLMQVFAIPLDLFTMLVATLAMGITVDNTVHFAHHFRLALTKTGNVRLATDQAFQNAGPALLTTAVMLSAGFYVFLFSDVSSIFNFGFLSGTAFVLAVLSNFTLTPVLLRWYAPRLVSGSIEEKQP